MAFSQSNQETCEALSVFVTGLTDETFNQPIMGTPPALTVTAKWYAATATVPEYCEVKGRIFPEIDFAVRMPSLAKWNRSAIHNGGGGWDGSIRSDPNDTTNAHVLDLGYPWSASDGGHDGNNGEFTVPDPYYQEFWPSRDPNPYACQKIVDMGNRAHRETPVLAKKIYKQYYGSFPVYTYYNGTSTGGREGLVEAQKNYDLFDGIYIGRPTGGHVAVCTRGIWDNVHSEPFALNHTVPPSDRVLYTGPTGNDPYYKAEALRAAVYDKCDGVDGLVDGVIDDPRKCNFDPLTDLPACPNDTEAARCFTLAQRQALKEIYRGPHDSQGNQYYVGQTLSAEWWTAPPPRYNFNFGAALLDSYANDMVRYTAWNQIYTAPPGPTWDMMTFNWDTDVQLLREATCTQYYPFDGSTRTYNIAEEMDAVTLSYPVKPNMGGFAPFKAKGGKIIHNHGWADALVSSLTSVSLYESVLQEMGIEETKNFWKLYMVPGMGHGSAGVGYPIDSWDNGFGALVKWVEKGVEPYELIGQRTNPAEKRLLCPYPEVARYSGPEGGSIWDPENFTCVPPIEVRIEPETLNLKSKGVFTAFITVPEGYDIRDWNIGNLECEGAKAVKGVFSANAYIAKFQTQDLVGVTHGDAVTLTVKGTFEVDGHTALIQADDTIRVIGNAPQKGKK